RHITSDPKLQTTSGQFDRAKFELILRNIGYSEQRFAAEQRQDLLRRQILDSLTADLAAPKAWLDTINQLANQQRRIDNMAFDTCERTNVHDALGTEQDGDVRHPTEAELNKYFDERKLLVCAQESRKIAIVTVNPAELAKWMEVSDEDIKQTYDQRHASFTTPERRHVEQIVFPTLADAQAAADRIKNGAHFTDIAHDRGLKRQDIDLGTIPKSRIVEPAVADAAFTLKEGEVSAPIQTRFGAALVRVLQIVPETTRSLADVTPQLRSDIALERAKSQVQNLHDKIEDDRAGGSTIEEAATKLKLPVTTYEVDQSERDPTARPRAQSSHGAEVIKAAFASDVGVDNDPIDADGGYIWYDVAAIAPARERTLDEVKTEVEQRWRDDEVASRLKSKSN